VHDEIELANSARNHQRECLCEFKCLWLFLAISILLSAILLNINRLAIIGLVQVFPVQITYICYEVCI